MAALVTAALVTGGYCYAKLAVFSPNGGCDHRYYSLCLSMEGWTGRVGVVTGLNTKMVYPQTVNYPSTNWARKSATMLIKTNTLPLSQTATNRIKVPKPNHWVQCKVNSAATTANNSNNN